MNNTLQGAPIAALPATTQAQLAALAERLGLTDVSGMDLEKLPADEQIELHQAIKAQLVRMASIYGLLIKPLLDAEMTLTAQIKAKIEAAGGKSLAHHSFNVNGVRKPLKVTEKLIALQDHLQGEELSAAVFAVATIAKLPPNQSPEEIERLRAILPGIKINTQTVLEKMPRDLAPQTIAELESAFPGVIVDVELDADGRKLNALLKKYGPNSEIGKIIVDGYTEAGPMDLEITPREPALKVVNGGAR